VDPHGAWRRISIFLLGVPWVLQPRNNINGVLFRFTVSTDVDKTSWWFERVSEDAALGMKQRGLDLGKAEITH